MKRLFLTILIFSGFFLAGKASAVTEFVSVVDPGNGSGTDYTSLSLWETGVQTDLTVAATQVFSGTRNNTVSDNATVYLCRSGAYQSHSGTVVHATSTQILIDAITGSATETSGDVWYSNNSCSGGTAYFTISDGGDSAIAVAKCRTTTGAADTTTVTINGWTTSATNYIKVWTDPTENYRHSGVWDDTKYHYEVNSIFSVFQSNVIIEGMQLSVDGNGLYISGASENVRISSCIIRPTTSAVYGIRFDGSASLVGYAYNNIVYGFARGIARYYDGAGRTLYVYNNTIIGSTVSGISDREGNSVIAINNIVQNSIDGYEGTFLSLSDFNISDVSTTDAPNATFEQDYVTVSFLDEANDDFHLSSSDTGARNFGTNLYSDSNLPITSDIDGDGRSSTMAFDIGADETAQEIYRSVAPDADGSMSAIDDDNSQQDTLSITTAGAATFEVAVDDIVGVGDALVFDDDADDDLDANDTILFIHARTDSTHFAVRTENGGWPAAATTDNDKWAIYRAYTSLSNAEAGTKNTAIPISFTGGNRDLVANNEQWNIAAYANGTTADTTAVTIDGWTTGEDNYLKVYTPVSSNEVGTSQRHGGKWDTSKYYLEIAAPNWGIAVFDIYEDFVRVDGIQVNITGGDNAYVKAGFALSGGASGDERVSNSIIRNQGTGVGEKTGIQVGGSAKVWNNIIYSQTYRGIEARWWVGATSYLYNNTVYGCGDGVYVGDSHIVLAKNNISYGNSGNDYVDGYGTVSSSSTHNLSEDATAFAYGTYYRSATVNFNSTTAGSEDFHLSPNDTSAIGAGTDLSADSYLPFDTDIDGDTRSRWDIGADEKAGENIIKGGTRLKGGVRLK